jgi:hypothetical protein
MNLCTFTGKSNVQRSIQEHGLPANNINLIGKRKVIEGVSGASMSDDDDEKLTFVSLIEICK